MPRMGRPPMPENMRRNLSLQLRLSRITMEKLTYCAKKLDVPRTRVIEQGIDMIYERLKKE